MGRIFLAGDSAHLFSPYGGQGMNMGIQDAFNLGWKLGLVLKNRASPEILSTYQSERKSVGHQAARIADNMSRITLLGVKWTIVGLLRDHIFLPLATHLPFLQSLLLNQFTGLGFHYAGCPGSMRQEDISFNHQISSLLLPSIGSRFRTGERWPNKPLFDATLSNHSSTLSHQPHIWCTSVCPDGTQTVEENEISITSHRMFPPGLHHLIIYDPPSSKTGLSVDALSLFLDRNRHLLDLFTTTLMTSTMSVDDFCLAVRLGGVGAADALMRTRHVQISEPISWFGREAMAIIIRPDGYVEYLCIPLHLPLIETYLSTVYRPVGASESDSFPSRATPISWKHSVFDHPILRALTRLLLLVFLLWSLLAGFFL